MSKLTLPVGIQSFRKLRERDCYYVDKTALIAQLFDEGEHYFLSRPRRFGKSLLLDTIKELFSCSEELFQGLDIHDHWNWDEPHPVLRLSFGGDYNEPGKLPRIISAQLAHVEQDMDVNSSSEDVPTDIRLRNLLYSLHRKTGRQVVVLVDEYDKPILDVLENPELAKANRDYLRGFYSVIKDCAEHVRFVFVTGVSMFSKVSLFSGMNNLKDISLVPRYATICGYTDHDLDTVFAPELVGLDRDEIRRWYNGYHWRGDEKLYNPYDILLLFSDREFQTHWFETGTPTMLYNQIKRDQVNPMTLNHTEVSQELVSKFDVGDVDLRALMFQSGYLTIISEERKNDRSYFTLDYPNLEVRQSFSEGLLAHMGLDQSSVADESRKLLSLLVANDFDGFGKALHKFIAGIPHQWYDNSKIENYEAHYASMLYIAFQTISANAVAEEASSHGRADMVIREGGQVFILEFKVAKNPAGADSAIEDAMAQIKKRGYADKYRVQNESVHLVAMIFGSDDRNLIAIQVEQNETARTFSFD